jgi:hypothetical protein
MVLRVLFNSRLDPTLGFAIARVNRWKLGHGSTVRPPQASSKTRPQAARRGPEKDHHGTTSANRSQGRFRSCMPQTSSDQPNFGAAGVSGGTSSFPRTLGEPGYVGLRSDASGAELAVSNAQWATDRYGLSMGDGPRFEMYIYVADLDGMLTQLSDADVPIFA